MADTVKMVNGEKCVLEEFWLPQHTVRAQCTCKIIDDPFGSYGPAGYHCGEDIIPAFALRNAMESIAN
jgi:hypothetical protein